MKEIEVLMTVLTEEEIAKIEPQQILVYDKFLGIYKVKWSSSKKFNCRRKVVIHNNLVYFSFKSLKELQSISNKKDRCFNDE